MGEDAFSIINLSEHPLTEVKRSVLELGLTFCPTADFNYSDTRIDLFSFIRKIKLKKHFMLKEGPQMGSRVTTQTASRVQKK